MKWGEPFFSGVLLGGYLGLMSLSWTAMLAGIAGWMGRWAMPSSGAVDLPRLSICIPARNEAHQIVACLQAALASDHPDFEVVLVDDGSTDGTAEKARSLQDSRLVVISGTPLPKGWSGKAWALTQAVSHASGNHLLFIDADVVLAPETAYKAAGVLVAKKLALLSLFGTWDLKSFWEKVAIPTIGWFVRGAVNMEAVNAPGKKDAFANGQFILVEKSAYLHAGGHGAIRQSVLDDVRLAEVIKQAGHPIGLFHAPEAFRVRLYRSLGEIIRGYTKNFYEGMGRNPSLALGAVLFLFIGAGLPYLLLFFSIVFPGFFFAGLNHVWLWQGWILGVCLLPVLFRYRVERLDGRSGALAWAHPLGNLVLGWILLQSMFSVSVEWKGREFHDGKAG
jgi:chlorobactene glucosyltransferase